MEQTPPGTGEAWRVGDLTIDVGQQRVVRAGTDIALPKLSFDLLLALARRSPNVVSSDELMSLVWPKLVVGPETVVQRVKLLRQALEDRSDDPRYIVALRGRGYRLVAPAQHCPPLPPPDAGLIAEPGTLSAEPPRSPDVPGPPGTKPRWPGIAAAVLALAAIGWLVVAALGNRQPATPGGDTGIERPTAVASDRIVAVLPFDNLSPQPEDAFIALSLPEMALNRLASVNGLTVIARGSSFRARQETDDLRQIGERLGAAFLVGGSVQRSGDKLRVTAHLVDSRTGTQLWSQNFDGTISDLFGLQDEIAARVAAAMEARVGGLALARPATPRSPNVEAYLSYLRGRALVGRFTVTEADAAAAEFARAIEIDPAFAAAHAALYDARMQVAGLRHDDLAKARDENRGLLERALALDDRSGAAWYARAMWEDLDVNAREAAYRKAMVLDPANTRGLVAFSEFLDITDAGADAARIVGSGFDPSSRSARTGPAARDVDRAAEAERVLEQALRIDPLSPRAHFRKAMRGFRRDASDVEAPILAILELDPEFYPALQRLAKYRALFHGHPAEAIAVIERAIRNDPQNPWGPHTAVAFYLDVGDAVAAEDVARTTPVSRDTARPLLALYAGDWRTAGRAAMQPRAFEFGFNESWGNAEALRDYALQSRDFAAPARLLRERFDLDEDGPPRVRLGNYRAAVALAHIEQAGGRGEKAAELLRAVIVHVDGDAKSPPVYKRRARAQALMLLGDTERALADLAASFRDDRDYTQWWYTLDRDPIWKDMRSDERFRALAAEVRAYAARERQAVEELRRRGEIPKRSDAGAEPLQDPAA
jgi:TolB-like protein/DNA-binding winged helix-turn-helix (wHTH) protein/tetratricopeptide (TPR) repeat protein